ncbi:MAG: glutaminyl-peptide cyclotransferase [Alistipes sp.]|nr:glutaminyl-peptide cyclotransferase [Alistipes sp.]
MKRIIPTRALLLLLLLLAACGNTSSRRSIVTTTVDEPTQYTYRVVNSYPHATDAYTQGLQFVDGALWEGTGEFGHSEIRTVELHSGQAKTLIRLPQSEFGEGITLLNGKLYQLTWTSNVCHVYDAANGRKIRDFRYAGEGWGLTSDGTKLYMSNGSATLYRLDPETFRREAAITVTLRGEPVPYLNELEWIDGKIWANVYLTDQILIIDPQTGKAEGVIDLSELLPASERTPSTDVLNGIAYDAATKRIFVTGKRWPKLYEIELIKP